MATKKFLYFHRDLNIIREEASDKNIYFGNQRRHDRVKSSHVESFSNYKLSGVSSRDVLLKSLNLEGNR